MTSRKDAKKKGSSRISVGIHDEQLIPDGISLISI